LWVSCRAYLQHLNKYRQRVWSCKYTGASGLTYEEAVLSEQRVGKVVEQVGAAGGRRGGGAGRRVKHTPACVLAWLHLHPVFLWDDWCSRLQQLPWRSCFRCVSSACRWFSSARRPLPPPLPCLVPAAVPQAV
jgi:hypothetical protein